MAQIEAKLAEMGLVLPRPLQVPADMHMSLPFGWVPVSRKRAFVSGHAPLNADGTIAQPIGKVGAEVSPDEGNSAARLVALAQLASLQRALGDLDRTAAWLRVLAMINVTPGFDQCRASRMVSRISSLNYSAQTSGHTLAPQSAWCCLWVCPSNARRRLRSTDRTELNCTARFRAHPARITACTTVLGCMPCAFVGALITDPRAKRAKLGGQMALPSQRGGCEAA